MEFLFFLLKISAAWAVFGWYVALGISMYKCPEIIPGMKNNIVRVTIGQILMVMLMIVLFVATVKNVTHPWLAKQWGELAT